MEFSAVKLSKIISGGQTGIDQSALFSAWKHGIQTGGTAPHGFLTSHGNCPVLQVFGLNAKGHYTYRTKENVKNSDATIILTSNKDSPGTIATVRYCKELQKPYKTFDISILSSDPTQYKNIAEDIVSFIIDNGNISVLNVAGNRELAEGNFVFKTGCIILNDVFELLKIAEMVTCANDK